MKNYRFFIFVLSFLLTAYVGLLVKYFYIHKHEKTAIIAVVKPCLELSVWNVNLIDNKTPICSNAKGEENER